MSSMFGSRRATVIASCVNSFIVAAMLMSLVYTPLKLTLFAHLVIGYFITKKIAADSKQPGHERLGLGHKIWYQLFYASIWPIILITSVR